MSGVVSNVQILSELKSILEDLKDETISRKNIIERIEAILDDNSVTDEYEYVEPEKETHIDDFNLDDERAEYLTTYANISGWLTIPPTGFWCNTSKFWSLLCHGVLFLYKDQKSDKPEVTTIDILGF